MDSIIDEKQRFLDYTNYCKHYGAIGYNKRYFYQVYKKNTLKDIYKMTDRYIRRKIINADRKDIYSGDYDYIMRLENGVKHVQRKSKMNQNMVLFFKNYFKRKNNK